MPSSSRYQGPCAPQHPWGRHGQLYALTVVGLKSRMGRQVGEHIGPEPTHVQHGFKPCRAVWQVPLLLWASAEWDHSSYSHGVALGTEGKGRTLAWDARCAGAWGAGAAFHSAIIMVTTDRRPVKLLGS